MMRPDLFCSKPFEWLDVSLRPKRGSAYLCCPSWLPVSTGCLTDDDMEIVWNGPVAQRIRESIHDGSFRHCTRSCPFLESATGPVVRRKEVEDPGLRELIDKRTTVLARGPTVVNAAFDRSCNLSCPTCRTDKLIEIESADAIAKLQELVTEQALTSARILYITGSGDAFGSPYFNRWLRKLERDELPSLEVIHLHTNGLLWTAKMWQQVPPAIRGLIRSCEVSIDAATAATYAVNRRGGRFEELLANAPLIKQLRNTAALDYVKIHMVVQANNFREMPDFVDLGAKFGADRIYFSRVANWGTFSRDEFRSIAVHKSQHPEHQQLLEVLTDERLGDPRVSLGNLGHLPPTRRSPLARPITEIGRLVESYIG